MLSMRQNMLDTASLSSILATMLSSIHRQEHLASGHIAGEAFSFAGGDRLPVTDAGAKSPKRQFEFGSPHQLSGTVIVGAMGPLIVNLGTGPLGIQP